MKNKFIFFFFYLLFIPNLFAQVNLSVKSEISIITAGPGSELYEAFGHSAIRIKDPILNIDLIYNYGVFDFNQPNFYTNFAKGNMIYTLARYDFKYFISSYRQDQRWLIQQVLNLNQEQKQAFFLFLEENALPQNRNYNYDPYFDNCATKLREITDIVLGKNVKFNDDYDQTNFTFRDLTNNEIHWNTWGSFGLNLIAGIPLDQKATSQEFLFLPDYILDSFRNASILVNGKSEKLIKNETLLLDFKELKPEISFINPFLIFLIISVLIILITYKDFKYKKHSKFLDFLIFTVTGLVGTLLLFLWFFSTHTTAPNNYNILWAFAPNLLIAFIMLRKRPSNWLKIYYKFLIILLAGTVILWLFQIQSYPTSLIPLLISIFIRYIFLAKRI